MATDTVRFWSHRTVRDKVEVVPLRRRAVAFEPPLPPLFLAARANIFVLCQTCLPSTRRRPLRAWSRSVAVPHASAGTRRSPWINSSKGRGRWGRRLGNPNRIGRRGFTESSQSVARICRRRLVENTMVGTYGGWGLVCRPRSCLLLYYERYFPHLPNQERLVPNGNS